MDSIGPFWSEELAIYDEIFLTKLYLFLAYDDVRGRMGLQTSDWPTKFR